MRLGLRYDNSNRKSAIILQGKQQGQYWLGHTGINREKETCALLFELSIQISPSDAGLHNHVHVVLVNLDNVVHVGKVDANASIRSREVTLETGASRVSNDRNTVAVTDSDNGGNLLSVSRICHGYRQFIWVDTRPARVAVGMQIVWICRYNVLFIPKLPNNV